MHIGRHYTFRSTMRWSILNFLKPLVWSALVVLGYELVGLRFLSIPTLPMSLIGIGVAFYLGFKNNASYDRMWEARKIWGAIVNASRSWAYGSRDLVSTLYGGEAASEELRAISQELVYRHVAWMDALRHQLRQLKSWEHQGPGFDQIREMIEVPEYKEDLQQVLSRHLSTKETIEALAQINPAAYLISKQSSRLAELRAKGLLDGFSHIHLQEVLQELMTQQGKAERIKNFPLPRQYATVNKFFALLFVIVLPFGLIPEFAKLGEHMVWLTVIFNALVGWVFLTADQIGDWSENPFEGLSNDVPISAMSRGIERDILQMIDEQELPPSRQPAGQILS